MEMDQAILYISIPFVSNMKQFRFLIAHLDKIYFISNIDVPIWIPSNSLVTNLTSTRLNSKFIFLLNSYVQKNATITGYEIYCAQKGLVRLSVL